MSNVGDTQTANAGERADEVRLLHRASMVTVFAGLAVSSIVAAGLYVIGDIGSWQARQLTEAIHPTSRFLFSSIMTASATILALMLTLLTIAEGPESDFDHRHDRRIRQIAFVDMLLLVGATCLLVGRNGQRDFVALHGEPRLHCHPRARGGMKA